VEERGRIDRKKKRMKRKNSCMVGEKKLIMVNCRKKRYRKTGGEEEES
jgi:hypothetical protein